MEKNKMLLGEKILTTSTDRQITLTTHRVRWQRSEWGRKNVASIMLENISMVAFEHRSYPLCLVLSLFLMVVGGLFILNSQVESVNFFGIVLLGAGLVFVGVYFSTLRHSFFIYGKGEGKIAFTARGLTKEQVDLFMDKIEQAQHERSEFQKVTSEHNLIGVNM